MYFEHWLSANYPYISQEMICLWKLCCFEFDKVSRKNQSYNICLIMRSDGGDDQKFGRSQLFSSNSGKVADVDVPLSTKDSKRVIGWDHWTQVSPPRKRVARSSRRQQHTETGVCGRLSSANQNQKKPNWNQQRKRGPRIAKNKQHLIFSTGSQHGYPHAPNSSTGVVQPTEINHLDSSINKEQHQYQTDYPDTCFHKEEHQYRVPSSPPAMPYEQDIIAYEQENCSLTSRILSWLSNSETSSRF
ncbi:uncharacterized protein MELLADRAFT_106693 [Melampsora larici-populina 98AG31]|uniref:Uncharacterized protein n=1 Tax=Melampsora larici-populina (strain 98AG31 / pathotype 3-4-7) TaxID=747676 RepID=F4RMB9_MELLP|nr:uncharacterized protein MELLADRAFT_106693 [Melampsora larici-populina 98AG31]EGG06498.1 hypothetical protein MELLADRAFT_106693 [Melampsora larici-populina 98AG31]